MNILSIDLNLLLVLHAVFEERSVVLAARRLHVTPSAVSNALARLRDVVGDALFVRSGRGLVATPRALELGPVVARALTDLAQGFGSTEKFDAAQSTRTFTIAMSDNDQVAHLPRFTAAFLRALPRARLAVVSIDALISGGGLGTPTADLAIAPPLEEPDLHHEPLYEEDAVVLVRRDHPQVPAPRRKRPTLSRERFVSLRHVDTHIALGRPGVGHRAASDVFARHGLTRDIALVVPTFSAAAMVAAHTDLLAALPRRVAEAFAAFAPVRVFELPAESPRMKLNLVWHERTHRDAGVRFVRELLLRSVREGGGKTVRAAAKTR